MDFTPVMSSEAQESAPDEKKSKVPNTLLLPVALPPTLCLVPSSPVSSAFSPSASLPSFDHALSALCSAANQPRVRGRDWESWKGGWTAGIWV